MPQNTLGWLDNSGLWEHFWHQNLRCTEFCQCSREERHCTLKLIIDLDSCLCWGCSFFYLFLLCWNRTSYSPAWSQTHCTAADSMELCPSPRFYLSCGGYHTQQHLPFDPTRAPVNFKGQVIYKYTSSKKKSHAITLLKYSGFSVCLLICLFLIRL